MVKDDKTKKRNLKTALGLIIFIVFYKALQDTNIYTPKKNSNNEIPLFSANLFYSNKTDTILVDIQKNQNSNRYRTEDRNMVPGFSTTAKTRPLAIAKMEEYTREKLVKLHSNRLIDELFN